MSVQSSKNTIRWKINGLSFIMNDTFDSFFMVNVGRIRAFLLSNMYEKDYGKAEDMTQDMCIRIFQSLYNSDGSLNKEKISDRVSEQSLAGYDISETEAFNHLVKNIIWSTNSNTKSKQDRRIELSYVGGGNEDMGDESVEALYNVIQNIACHDNSFEKVRVVQFYEDLRDSFKSEKIAQVWELVTMGYCSEDIMDLLNLDCYFFYKTISEGRNQYNDILCTHFTPNEMNID